MDRRSGWFVQVDGLPEGVEVREDSDLVYVYAADGQALAFSQGVSLEVLLRAARGRCGDAA